MNVSAIFRAHDPTCEGYGNHRGAKNDGVAGIVDYESTEYSSHELTKPIDQAKRIEWVLVIRSNNGKKS